MYKLKYSLLLPIVMVYAANACAMTRTAELGRRTASQLGQRAATTAPRWTPAAAASFNRPYTTARVFPAQQTPTTQQAASGRQVDSTNRSPLATRDFNQGGSGGESFWERYNKYGLTAAIAGWWATEQKEMSVKEKDEDARINMFKVCGHTNTTVNQALDGESTYSLPRLREESPKCARALSDFCSARIALLLELLRDKSLSKSRRSEYVAEIKRLGEMQKILK